MNIKVLILILVVLCTQACNQAPKNIEFLAIHTKDIKFENVPFQVTQINTRFDSNLTTPYLIYYNNKTDSLGLYFNGKNSNIHAALPSMNNMRRFSSAFYVHTLDSIFYFDTDKMSILLFDTSGKSLKEYKLKSAFEPDIPLSSFFVFYNDLYYSWLPYLDTNTTFSRGKAYSSVAPFCKVNFKTKNLPYEYTTFGEYPDNYKKGLNYYNFSPNIFLGLNGEIISSFESDHTLYIYKNDKLIKQKVCKSNYIDKFDTVPDEKFTDLSFVSKFQGEQPKYVKLIVDPYQRRYYRISKLRFNTSDMKSDKLKWSIIILDENFDVLGESLLSYADYIPDIIIPTNDGLFIQRSPKLKEDFEGNLILSLLQFKQ